MILMVLYTLPLFCVTCRWARPCILPLLLLAREKSKTGWRKPPPCLFLPPSPPTSPPPPFVFRPKEESHPPPPSSHLPHRSLPPAYPRWTSRFALPHCKLREGYRKPVWRMRERSKKRRHHRCPQGAKKVPQMTHRCRHSSFHFYAIGCLHGG